MMSDIKEIIKPNFDEWIDNMGIEKNKHPNSGLQAFTEIFERQYDLILDLQRQIAELNRRTLK